VPQRGRLFNAHVSARCHEPGSDAEERSRHAGGAPPQKKIEAKRETSGRNRALFAGAACTWARSSAVTNTERREPGVRAAWTWARSCTVINAERSKPGSRSICSCLCASLFLLRVLFGAVKAPSQVCVPHACGKDQVPSSTPSGASQVRAACTTACARLSFCFEFSLGWPRRQARCARRMHVGKIKYRDQHQNGINGDQGLTSRRPSARTATSRPSS